MPAAIIKKMIRQRYVFIGLRNPQSGILKITEEIQ